MRAAVSWSGGKDSCLSHYKAMLDGLEISYLLNFASKDGRCMSHGLNSKLIAAQSHALEIPIVQREVTWDTYEREFKLAIHKLKDMGVEAIVFGDIDVREHRDWVYRVCGEAGIKPLEPLWGLDPEQILTSFIDEGFEAIIINAKADLLGEGWLERRVDRSLIEDFKKLRSKRDFHICGEWGEYHTLVTDGPTFKKRLKVLGSRRVLREGYWKFWLLDILRYGIEEK